MTQGHTPTNSTAVTLCGSNTATIPVTTDVGASCADPGGWRRTLTPGSATDGAMGGSIDGLNNCADTVVDRLDESAAPSGARTPAGPLPGGIGAMPIRAEAEQA